MSYPPDKPHPCHDSKCTGTCRYSHDDYGSLGQGGSYEIWVCDKCGKRTWVMLPD